MADESMRTLRLVTYILLDPRVDIRDIEVARFVARHLSEHPPEVIAELQGALDRAAVMPQFPFADLLPGMSHSNGELFEFLMAFRREFAKIRHTEMGDGAK